MVAEEVVLAAAWAVGATHAADKENGHARRHQDCEQASIHRKPVNQAMHIEGHHIVASETSHLRNGARVFRASNF
jgi:hypothetical protein